MAIELRHAQGGLWKRYGRASISNPAGGGSDPVAHGADLTPGHTGYGALGASQGQLQTLTTPGRGYFEATTPFEFVPNQTYVYNNNSANKGGIVPGGGLTIDGYSVPAGTYVSQFRDFGEGVAFSGSGAGFFFRGCRFRGPELAPGFFNMDVTTDRKIWIGYCDLGGLSAANADYCEGPIKMTNSLSGGVIYRNYITYITTGIQINADGFDVVENYIDKLTFFYGPGIPPGESSSKHINGMTFNGGEACARILRNHVTCPNPDEAGRTIDQTDCISFFQDFGSFPGTGLNADGSHGYQVLDNYIGGTGYCIYAGRNNGTPSTSVSNMVITGNKVTTQWWPDGGFNGPVTAEPPFGVQGNVWSNNTWADGPNVGQQIPE